MERSPKDMDDVELSPSYLDLYRTAAQKSTAILDARKTFTTP